MSEELAQTMDMGASVEADEEVGVDEPEMVSDKLDDDGAADKEVRAERVESREEVRVVSREASSEGEQQASSAVPEEKPVLEQKAGAAAPQPQAKVVTPIEPAVKMEAGHKADMVVTNGREGSAEAMAMAAAALQDAYRAMPGVVADLVQGSTVDEVKASYEAAQKAYSDIKAAVLREQGVAVPQARGGSSLPPVPGDPLSMILAGVVQPKR